MLAIQDEIGHSAECNDKKQLPYESSPCLVQEHDWMWLAQG